MQQCNLFISIPFTVGGADWDTAPTYANTAPAVKRSYLDAVLAEMRGFAEEAPSLAITSVTFGTGSMSTIPESDLREFLSEISRLFSIAPTTPVYATFDPGLISIGQANEFKAFGAPRLEFRYFTSDAAEADSLGMPSGETEMKKSSILLEQVGFQQVVMHIAIGIAGQTKATLEKSLRDALRSIVEDIELVSLSDEWSGAQDDDDTAALFEHARTWLEEHGYRSTTPTRFMRDGGDDFYHANLYASSDGPDGFATLSFGPSTISVFDGLLWANGGDINRYIRESADPKAITAQVAELDAAALEQRRVFDALYRGNTIRLDEACCKDLLDEGLLLEVEACDEKSGDTADAAHADAVRADAERTRTVSLSSKGRIRYRQVFERLSHLL